MSKDTALFLAPSAYIVGGIQTWLDQIAERMHVYGIRPIVGLCAGVRHDYEAYVRSHPKLECFPITNPTGSRFGRVSALCEAMSKTHPRWVVSANVADAYAAFTLYRSRVRAGACRSVMTLHGIQPEFFSELPALGAQIDAVVAPNRLACALAVRAGVESRRVFYAACGTEVDHRSVMSSRVSEPLGGVDPIRIAYVGRLDEFQKRVSLVASLCDTLYSGGTGFEFWIAGSGPDEAHLRSSLSAHEQAGRVRWLGRVPAQEVADRVYQQVDLLINPSYWETGPIVAWEAMANGVVVVSSRYIGSGLEGALVDDVNCKLFEIGDAHGAASAIQSLCEPEARARLRAGGYELVRARYSVNASVAAWAESLHRIAELPPRPPATINFPESGRLDRWLGLKWGERVRRSAGLRFKHSEPGAEWPHSYGAAGDTGAFWRRSHAIDRAVE